MSTVINQEASSTIPQDANLGSQLSSNSPGEHATIRSAEHRMMVRSKLNVRRKCSDVSELAALIRSQGLLQNLVGFLQVGSGARAGMVEIVAGGRRLEAIGMLIAQGHLPEDYRIPYLCVTEAEAVDISLAENLGRADMHPADVFEAMLALSERGRSVDDIPLNFHVDPLTVRRRLKLANVSPRMLALYRNDEASFEHMMALAITDDHAAQEQAWDSLGKHQRYPHELRRLLTARQINVQTDRVARFVGAAAFEHAGGVISRDLFSSSGGGYIDDAALLERLALAKLEKERRKVAKEGHAWVDIMPRADRATLSEFARVRTARRTLSEAELAELASLQGDIERRESELAGLAGDDEQSEALGDQLEQLRDRCRVIRRDGAMAPIAEDKALSGAVISLDDSGNVLVRRELIRPTDKSRMVKLSSADGECGARRKGTHSDRLTRMLTSHRTAALQAEMIGRPDVALAVLTHTLVNRVLFLGSGALSCAKVTSTTPALAVEAKGGAAAIAIQTKRQELLARLPGGQSGEEVLAWSLCQPEMALLELLAFCVASSLDTVQEREGDSPGFVELALALDLDMRKWWQPTAANYFSHVSKERISSVVAEAISPAAAAPLEKMTKSVAADAAERALANVAWLPEPLRAK